MCMSKFTCKTLDYSDYSCQAKDGNQKNVVCTHSNIKDKEKQEVKPQANLVMVHKAHVNNSTNEL